MSVLPARRRAEEFARLLDAGTGTVDPGLAPLAALAGRLQALPVGPSPEFRVALRQRLVAVAAVQADALPATGRQRTAEFLSSWRGQRRLAFAAGTATAALVIAGVGVSASRSLPGDPFYGLKRATESVQLAFAHGPYAKG